MTTIKPSTWAFLYCIVMFAISVTEHHGVAHAITLKQSLEKDWQCFNLHFAWFGFGVFWQTWFPKRCTPGKPLLVLSCSRCSSLTAQRSPEHVKKKVRWWFPHWYATGGPSSSTSHQSRWRCFQSFWSSTLSALTANAQFFITPSAACVAAGFSFCFRCTWYVLLWRPLWDIPMVEKKVVQGCLTVSCSLHSTSSENVYLKRSALGTSFHSLGAPLAIDVTANGAAQA